MSPTSQQRVSARQCDDAGFWGRVEELGQRWDVTQHPFYQRWSGGDLAPGELAHYAGQYRHAVVAIARLSEAAARVAPDVAVWDELEVHAAEERRHIELWDCFVDAVGGDTAAAAAPLTRYCVEAWAPPQDRPLLSSLIALHAIEAAEPRVAKLKRTALVSFYGIDAPSALSYFDVHEHLDVKHADDSRALIAAHWRPEKETQLLAEAEHVLQAGWRLLDGVDLLA